MNGVEVLAISEVAIEFAFNWKAFWIVSGIIFGIFVIFGIIMSIEHCDWSNLLIYVIAGTVLAGIFGSIFGAGFRIEKAHETQYKVVISDEVSMNEFTENYEIIDQDGKIYTVRDRN